MGTHAAHPNHRKSFSNDYLTSHTNVNFATLKIQKHVNLPLTFYLCVYMTRDPKFGPTNHEFCGEFESELRSGFRARDGELKCSGVFESEGDNSPLRGARSKLTSYSDYPYKNPNYTYFLVPTCICGWIYRPERCFGPGKRCCSGR